MRTISECERWHTGYPHTHIVFVCANGSHETRVVKIATFESSSISPDWSMLTRSYTGNIVTSAVLDENGQELGFLMARGQTQARNTRTRYAFGCKLCSQRVLVRAENLLPVMDKLTQYGPHVEIDLQELRTIMG